MFGGRLFRILSSPCTGASSPGAATAAAAAAEATGRTLEIGDVLKQSRRFSAADVVAYSELSGDHNPVHLDADFARRIAGFDGGRVVHGALVASLFPSVIASHFPGAVYISQTLQFKQPVYIGDEVIAEVHAIHLREYQKRYIVKFTTKCFKNGECLVLDGEAMTIIPALLQQK